MVQRLSIGTSSHRTEQILYFALPSASPWAIDSTVVLVVVVMVVVVIRRVCLRLRQCCSGRLTAHNIVRLIDFHCSLMRARSWVPAASLVCFIRRQQNKLPCPLKCLIFEVSIYPLLPSDATPYETLKKIRTKWQYLNLLRKIKLIIGRKVKSMGLII